LIPALDGGGRCVDIATIIIITLACIFFARAISRVMAINVINDINTINNVYIAELIYVAYIAMKQTETQVVAKLVRVSDRTYEKLQKAQRVRESYGEVVDRAVDALLEKEQKKQR
jgi:hypothetical protein